LAKQKDKPTFGRSFSWLTLLIVLNAVAVFPAALLAWLGFQYFLAGETNISKILAATIIFCGPCVACSLAALMGLRYEDSDRKKALLWQLIPLPLALLISIGLPIFLEN
jgi:hypothetical protein